MLCSPTMCRISHVNSNKSKACDTKLMAMTLILGLLRYGDKFQNLMLTHKPTTTRPRDIKRDVVCHAHSIRVVCI